MTAAQWFEQKAIPAVERWWRPVAILALIVVGLLVGKNLLGLLGRAVGSIFGAPTDPRTFTPIAGDPVHVIVRDMGKDVVVALPKGADGKQLTSDVPGLRVGYGTGYTVKADNNGPKTDRKG